jgi:hypothetical protein
MRDPEGGGELPCKRNIPGAEKLGRGPGLTMMQEGWGSLAVHTSGPEGVSHFLTVVYFGLGKEEAAEPTGP